MKNLALLTDLYQLTMMAGYHGLEKTKQQSCFELFFRRLPFSGGFAVAAGLQTAVDYLQNLRFQDNDLEYLRSLGLFSESFLQWLKDFRFEGDVDALPEGELVFPGEPLLRVRAPLPQAQLVESALLNILNFQTLIATKAARIYLASKKAPILEFGLRRAQGVDGALSASRAAFIGGCEATSNVLSGRKYGIPVRGTHAHSWIMSFSSELEAFRAYANLYPDGCTLLVDTYDTLGSGVPNAVKVGLELAERGHELKGIRLDSGDLAYLSKRARAMLDEAGLNATKIIASNDLNEEVIADLIDQEARIDIWGVGTQLVTSHDQPALGGVYKLVAAEDENGKMQPRIKVSSNMEKITVPGIKQLYRAFSQDEKMLGDCLATVDETPPTGFCTTYHPHYATGQLSLDAPVWRPLLQPVLRQGKVLLEEQPLSSLRQRFLNNLQALPLECQRRVNPHIYWVGLSANLRDLRDRLLEQARRQTQETGAG